MAIGLVPLLMTGCVARSPALPPVTEGSASSPAATPTVSSSAAVVVLSATGIGPFVFDKASREDVSAYLAQAFGAPATVLSDGDLGDCEGGAGRWGSTEQFGDLVVQYYAADGSPASPQLVESWNLMGNTAPDPPLALAPDIPTGLTMGQLQAKYPDGGDFQSLGVWVANGVEIAPPSDAGTGFIFAGLIDWCT